ncbi:MAG: hypothetical protein FWD73_08880 [Polyangiaceae bacterium]|nr:hypothetical protein [Polyangiaceae bacterium]
MNRPELNEDFVDLLRSLQQAEVEFVIVGAHALAAHGLSRATGDLDVFVEPTPDNANRILAALRAFGAPLDQHGVTRSDFEASDTVYQIGLPPRRIDLMTSITGVSFDEACGSRMIVEVEGMQLPVLGRQALLRNKRATGRAKDSVDADMLEKLQNPR